MRYGTKFSIQDIVDDIKPHVGDFVEVEGEALGNQDSAHNVRFGESSELGPIAVKPFGKYQRAWREAWALDAVAQKGILAIEPLKVAQGALAAYLITRHVPDLRHLGQLDWKVEAGSSRLRTVIAPTLNEVASTLAGNHKRQVVHGDYQPKNAMRLPTGEQIYGDAEKTWVDPPVTEMTGLGNKDVALFGATALSWGLLQDSSPSYRAGYVNEELLDPYLRTANPEQFAMSPEERQQAIVNYWVEGMKRGGVASWPGKQMQGGR